MFGRAIDYFDTAREYEALFRSVLRDIKANVDKRPYCSGMPKDLNVEGPLEDIFEKCSRGNRHGIFTITDFEVNDKEVVVGIEDVATLSGGGADLVYEVGALQVTYKRHDGLFMS